jgi:hypothetical protein
MHGEVRRDARRCKLLSRQSQATQVTQVTQISDHLEVAKCDTRLQSFIECSSRLDKR